MLNKKTVKGEYSCTQNLGSTIKDKSRKLLNETEYEEKIVKKNAIVERKRIAHRHKIVWWNQWSIKQ